MLPLLLACAEPDEAPPAEDTSADTAADTADPGPGPSPFSDAADLTLAPCGTDEVIGGALDAGADLDGDALAEVLVSAPGNDAYGIDYGAVYVFAGSSAGALGPGDALATLYVDEPDFELAARWYDDLDGDGVPEVQAGGSFFPGWRVALGGALTSVDALPDLAPLGTPWADVDGDGVREVLSTGGDPDDRIRILDGAAALAGDISEVASVRVGAWHTGVLEVVGDRDGDGLAEVVTREGEDLVVYGSAALLAGDDPELQRADGLGYSDGIFEGYVLPAGDLDGDGFDDIVAAVDEPTFVPSGGGAATLLAFPARLHVRGLARGDDLDGDGVEEVWLKVEDADAPEVRFVAISGAQWAAGTADVAAPVARVTLASARYGGGLAVGDALWVGDPVTSRGPGRVHAFDVAAGTDVDEAAARATVTGESFGAPEWPFDIGSSQALWADLDGDGETELVLEADEVGYTVPRADVLAGGTPTMCDLTPAWSLAADTAISDVLLPGDLDGDGAGDVLVVRGDGFPYRVDQLTTAAFLADPEAAGRVLFEGDAAWPDRMRPVCDVDGDGVAEWLGGEVGTFGDHLIRGADVATTVTLDSFLAVVGGHEDLFPLADLDGDGGCEVGAGVDGGFAIFRSADVAAGGTLTADDALALIEAMHTGAGVAVGDVDGDGLVEVALGTRDHRGAEVRVYAGADIAAGGTLTAWDALQVAEGWSPTAYPDLDGDGVDELLVWDDPDSGVPQTLRLYDSGRLRAGDAETSDAAWTLAVPDDAPTLLALGPDLLGRGLPALLVRWEDLETGFAHVSVFFGR